MGGAPDADNDGHDDARFSNFGSRWGIKGSSEVSEGLTAIYKFETRIGQGDASQDTNQIYAGLSGGFGTLMLGKFHNAAYLAGGIRDIGNWHGGSDVKSKRGNTVSYSYSAEAFTLQVDAIMDGGSNTGKAIDEAQFGLAVNMGDLGKVAIGYEKHEDEVGAMGTVVEGNALVASADDDQDKFGYKASHISASFGLGSVTARLGYSVKDTNMTRVMIPNPDENARVATPKVLRTVGGDGDNADHPKVDKMKTTFVGATGSIGDTGIDWRAFGRKVEGHNGIETSPWGAGMGKALGGGVYTFIEHENKDDGEDGTTSIALVVNF